jgi:Flp pilus assembly pilin Flp
MWKMLRNLWADERGSLTADWALIAAVLALVAVAGTMMVHPSAADADDILRPAPAAKAEAPRP